MRVRGTWLSELFVVALSGLWQPLPPRWPSDKASASRAGDTGIESLFSRSSHTYGTTLASLPGVLRHSVGARTSWRAVITL